MYFDFLNVAVLLAGGVLFVYVNMIVLSLVRPKNPNALKLSTYECGIEATGSSWIRFDMRFYTLALIFVIFDVEIAFLFPWAAVFRELGIIALVEGVLFIVILALGLVYVWAKGDLDWTKAFSPHALGMRQEPSAGETPQVTKGARSA
jgi:NADH-quinone oxidoreductase subunit A